MICDYEGSDYKTRFWQNADRAYEDAVERIAVKKLLPNTGGRIVELGAGFGRLADLYASTRYDEIILLDYSRSLLQQAAEKWGHDSRFKFVVADLYHLPFAPAVLNGATMIRVIHHIADVPAVLAQVRAAMAPGGTFVLEFANKRNLKAMARYALRKQRWNPYTPEPVEFVRLNFDFHPRWMTQQLHNAGFRTRRQLAVSYLRTGLFKRLLSLKTMSRLDDALQNITALGLYSPSVFTQNEIAASPRTDLPLFTELPAQDLFRSPRSGASLRLVTTGAGKMLYCEHDGTQWRVDGNDNFFDFKEPA